jgi:hypothetical protein
MKSRIAYRGGPPSGCPRACSPSRSPFARHVPRAGPGHVLRSPRRQPRLTQPDHGRRNEGLQARSAEAVDGERGRLDRKTGPGGRRRSRHRRSGGRCRRPRDRRPRARHPSARARQWPALRVEAETSLNAPKYSAMGVRAPPGWRHLDSWVPRPAAVRLARPGGIAPASFPPSGGSHPIRTRAHRDGNRPRAVASSLDLKRPGHRLAEMRFRAPYPQRWHWHFSRPPATKTTNPFIRQGEQASPSGATLVFRPRPGRPPGRGASSSRSAPTERTHSAHLPLPRPGHDTDAVGRPDDKRAAMAA